MKTSIPIVGIGARTPLGLQAAPSAAAVRAGVTTALGEHPFMVDSVGDLMPAALDQELDPRLVGPKRLLVLAETPLREAGAPLGTGEATCPPWFRSVDLPEFRPGFTP